MKKKQKDVLFFIVSTVVRNIYTDRNIFIGIHVYVIAFLKNRKISQIKLRYDWDENSQVSQRFQTFSFFQTHSFEINVGTDSRLKLTAQRD